MPGTVYTVASGKGGVGKTTTSVNLAVALWREGNAVALVDADIGMANLAAVLDLEPEETLHDVLAGRATVEEAVIEAKDGDLMVLPGSRSLERFADADPNALRAAVSELAGRADYVIVDTGAGLSYEDVLPLGMADGVVLVTTPDPAAFGDTMKTMELADLLGAPIRGLVVTRAVEDTNTEAIAAEIGAELLGAIPEDPAVMASTVAGDPLESHAPDSEAAAAYRDLATAVLEGDEEWLAEHGVEPAAAVTAGVGEPVAAGDPDAVASPGDGEGGADEGPEASAAPDATVEDEAVVEDVEAGGASEATVAPGADEDGPANDAEGPEADADGTGVDAANPTTDDEPDDVEGAAEVDESGDGPGGEEAADPQPEEPAETDEEPRTFPAGGVPREGGTTGGETTDEAEAEDDTTDEEGADTADEAGEQEVASDEPDDGGEERDDDAGSEEAEEGRGGFFGWLGRRFS